MPKSQVKQSLSKDDIDLLCQQVCTELSEPQQNLFFFVTKGRKACACKCLNVCGFLILGLQQHLLAGTVQQCVQRLQVNSYIPPKLSLMPEKCRYALSSALLCKPQTLPAQQILPAGLQPIPLFPGQALIQVREKKKRSLA